MVTIRRYISLVDVLAKMRMKSQANKLALSYAWWLLEPLLFVSLFYFLFSYVLQRGGDDYFSFMIVGKIVYLWFSKSVTTASTSLILNKGILAQRSLPKWIFPMASIHETTYKAVLSFLLLFFVLIINGYFPSVYWLQVIPLVGVMYLLIVGVSLVTTILVSIAQDFTNLINMGLLGLMFASGIFWDINTIQNEATKDLILIFNPLAAIINCFREALVGNVIIDYIILLPSIFLAITLISLSVLVLKKWNNKLTRCLFS
ncbi:ABC transporter permease [Vibrio cyclitrophicus]|uniref:ABC transporter permease n=1 Tax=Vibrio cyclitrophicus TaxID=47951 RepID=UPI00031FF79D|nr:ABC transporter permease [Vibrio cyclitrophicus]OCH48061.1 hypothetical protein A6D96_15045 [Vibrio cyclitrophicus]